MKTTITDLIMEYFRKHPNEDIKHGPVVDWVSAEYLKTHPHRPRDTWRAIRMLHQEGILIKVKMGVYRFDPDFVKHKELFDFTSEIKKLILERDGYKCVVCGRGKKDGIELVVDHKRPKDKGGLNTIDNGQTLCSEHNLIKKNYSMTEAGKRYFIKIYEQAVENEDDRMIEFCKSVFDVYNEFDINGHIRRPNGN